MVQPLRRFTHLACHKGVVSVAVCTVVTTGKEDAANIRSSSNDEVKLVPAAGARVPPRHLVDLFALEKGVGHAQSMVAQKLKQSLAILIYLSPPKASEAGGLSLMVSSYSCIEISEKVKAISARDPRYCFL